MSNRSLVIIDGGLAGHGGMMSFNDVERIVLNENFRVEATMAPSQLTVVGVHERAPGWPFRQGEGDVYDTSRVGPNRMLIPMLKDWTPRAVSAAGEGLVDAGLTTISVKALASSSPPA